MEETRGSALMPKPVCVPPAIEDTRGNGDEAMVVFPSEASAVRCQAFVERYLAGVRADEPRVEPPRYSRLVPVFEEAPPEGTLQLTAVAVPCVAHALSSITTA